MCDYHLKGTCFHPKRVEKGFIALPCEVHECEHCTNKTWQDQQINTEYTYYQSIVDMISATEPNASPVTTIQEKNEAKGKSFSFSFLRNPLQGLFK